MDAEIQLVSDGDGLAVIGDKGAVESFLASQDLPSTDLELPRLGAVLSTGSVAAQAGSEIADYLAAIDEKVDDVLRAQKTRCCRA